MSRKKQPAPPAEPLAISEDLAIAIAHGCAASTYDVVSARERRDDEALPRGEFWYFGGQVLDTQIKPGHLRELAQFVMGHPTSPGEALYLHATANIARRRDGAWVKRPLAERMAFEAFSRVLVPLIDEVRADAKRRLQRAAATAPPPDLEVFVRIGQEKPFGARLRMTHEQPRPKALKEAAE